MASFSIASSDKHVPLIAHVLYRLDFGGLENGLVNLLNSLPEDRYRHAVICLTDYSEFANRIQSKNVELFALHKLPGNSVKMHGQIWNLFRKIKPAIVHTRNLGSLETQVPAALASVPIRIHSEHGRDMDDLKGQNRKNQWIRRLYSPFVHHYIALSKDLEEYLASSVGIGKNRISQLYNGVNINKFTVLKKQRIWQNTILDENHFVIGTVGRMQKVKDQVTFAKAFIRALELDPEANKRLRLTMIGDGHLREEVLEILKSAGVEHLAWLPGARNEVADLMGGFDLFVLPSLAEGISNTILEAMASGLPVLATNVGGNAELVDDKNTGKLVESSDIESMARSILDYYHAPELAKKHGLAGRMRVEELFSLNAMVNNYAKIYDNWLARSGFSLPNKI